ncbi:EBP-domain-containing protein [Annulohypoxylon truncatum]|uniref:EBP-domain-containing protein n=1 Tax=Annulohypoxylon truncatum TaxID=327061 RepID=UPI002007921E|nr:EBP-domain-containing protein [Annulohypoxylon truncatum]KAI1213055.1 EBP-domain-containing protein [Annulohypoxylon truncatum]
MSMKWWPFGGYKVSSEDIEPSHPYYPLGVYIPAYAPNEFPVYVLLSALVGMLGFAVLGASAVALKFNPKLTRSNLAVFCWFVMNGCLHCFFEGYFVINHDTVASSQNLFAQLWKEYALSDSRYLTSDCFMLSVESITALVWGPLCFANAVSIVRGSPYRHVLRIIICMAHIYGVALYYSTSLCQEYMTDLSHSRPEFLYFWVYYVGFNLPWAIIPSILIYDSTKTITKAIRTLDRVDSTLKTHRQKQDGKRGAIESRKTK